MRVYSFANRGKKRYRWRDTDDSQIRRWLRPPPPPQFFFTDLHDSLEWPISSWKRRISPKGVTSLHPWITTLFKNVSPPRHPSAILENIHWTQTAYAVLCQLRHAETLFSFRSKRKRCKQRTRILSKMALGWRGGHELLNKVVIFVFFAYRKYSRSIVKLRFGMTWG